MTTYFVEGGVERLDQSAAGQVDAQIGAAGAQHVRAKSRHDSDTVDWGIEERG